MLDTGKALLYINGRFIDIDIIDVGTRYLKFLHLKHEIVMYDVDYMTEDLEHYEEIKNTLNINFVYILYLNNVYKFEFKELNIIYDYFKIILIEADLEDDDETYNLLKMMI